MKNIITGLILTILTSMMFACKSGKAGCDAYGKIESNSVSKQASK
jgi:hypothetical protein